MVSPGRPRGSLIYETANWREKSTFGEGWKMEQILLRRLARRFSTEPFTSVTAVFGPPGSGKTTWVQEQHQAGDLVLDLDWLFYALSGLPTYEKPDQLLPFVASARDAIIERLKKPSELERAWVISSEADWEVREAFRQGLGARVVVMETPLEVCLERVEERGGDIDWPTLVKEWWDDYEPLDEDEVLLS